MKILGYDLNLYLEHFVKLAREGNEIRLYSPWQTASPKFQDYAVGTGFDGIEKVLYFWEHIDWADMIVIFDVGLGDIVTYLRNQGKVVMGNGRAGEDLEQNRWFLKQLMKKLNMPVQPTVRVQGVTELRKYLEANPDKYVKVDIFRGTEGMESFEAKNLESVELRLDRIETALGPWREKYQFIVEDNIKDATEPGFDLWFNGREFVKPYLYAWELHKNSYLGRFIEEMPKPLQYVADKLTPYLREIDYRGPLSTEMRITKDGTPYLIDICSRLPSPCSTVYVEAISNYTELVYKCAKSEPVRIKPTGKYVSILPLESQEAQKNWVRLDFDPGFEKNIKVHLTSKVDGVYYAVPGSTVVLVLIAVGNNIDDLKIQIQLALEKVHVDGLDNGVSLDPLYEELDKIGDYGLYI